MKIAWWGKTSLACPAQWEGELADGRALYIRYRSGVLRLHVAESIEEAVAAPPLFVARCGEELKREDAVDCAIDGFLDEHELREALPPWIAPPAG